jgi:hypothetical protein
MNYGELYTNLPVSFTLPYGTCGTTELYGGDGMIDVF